MKEFEIWRVDEGSAVGVYRMSHIFTVSEKPHEDDMTIPDGAVGVLVWEEALDTYIMGLWTEDYHMHQFYNRT